MRKVSFFIHNGQKTPEQMLPELAPGREGGGKNREKRGEGREHCQLRKQHMQRSPKYGMKGTERKPVGLGADSLGM